MSLKELTQLKVADLLREYKQSFSRFCGRFKDYIVKAATAFESSFFITAETR
jgi:hypothetical protein